MTTKETIESLLTPLEKIVRYNELRGSLSVSFYPSSENAEEGRYFAMVDVSLTKETVFVNPSSIYNSSCSPLEAIDTYARISSFIHAIGFQVTK
jgi:hypothetical protein